MKKYVFLLIAVLLFLSGNGFANSQGINSDKIAVNELIEDFDYLKGQLERYHAGLYRYTSKTKLDQIFHEVKNKLSKPMTQREFLSTIIPAITNINCGHTYLLLSASEIYDRQNSPINFPFSIKIFNHKVYLINNHSKNTNIPYGSELLEINGISIDIIVKNLLQYITSDGHIETFQYYLLENGFYKLYHMIYGASQIYNLKYREVGGKEIKTISVNGVTKSQIHNLTLEKYPHELKEPKFKLEFDAITKTAILSIRTFQFSSYKYRKKFPAFLKKSFTEIEKRKINTLIIDFRGNGGGGDVYGKQLVSYLLDRPFFYYKTRRKKYDIIKYMDFPSENLGIQQPSKPVFGGKIYVLINGGTFSTTGECVSILDHHKRATFIGEESGGGFYGNTSGIQYNFELPNTGFQVIVPGVEYILAVDNHDRYRGVIPEHQVEESIDDFLKGRDTILKYTLDLIKNK